MGRSVSRQTAMPKTRWELGAAVTSVGELAASGRRLGLLET